MDNNIKYSEPLVSVMMPAYNAEKTIRFALASLLMQTYKNWECFVVDDGSTDNTASIVRSINDNRIRLIQFPNNMGRGVARQRALEASQGDYIAMLDADDWIYPQKLEKQVEILAKYADVSLVSSGMAIVDKKNNICGIRCVGDGKIKVFIKPGQVPVAHAPSLYRKKDVGLLKYDSRFKFAQDVDFLRRFLLGKKYVVLKDTLYCYSEIESVNLIKAIKGYYYNIQGLKKFINNNHIFVSFMIIEEIAKLFVNVFLGTFGLYKILLKNRFYAPAPSEIDNYINARSTITNMLAKM